MADTSIEVISDDEFDAFSEPESDGDFMMEENAAPAKKNSKAKATKAAPKKAAAPKKKAAKAKALGDNNNAANRSEETIEVDSVAKGGKKEGKKKTVEETYQKKTQLEHILLRPDTYSKFLLCCCSCCCFVRRAS